MGKRYVNHEGRNYYPNDGVYDMPAIVDVLVAGCVPNKPLIDKKKCIVAFGSCFADHVSTYLKQAGYNVTTRGEKSLAYIASMGDGVVNTFAILQQFEWAWLNKKPSVALWYGYDSRELGYKDEIRVETKRLLDQTEVFILTLGLSEVWYDEPTGEVFWRVLPGKYFDPKRHKFRMATQGENLANLRSIVSIIQKHRPGVPIVFTLSPIPLKVTYREQSCVVANEASKANLRSALDELMLEHKDDGVYYFPSYELVRDCFNNAYTTDRRHIYQHIIDFVMSVFDHYFCGGITAEELSRRFAATREQDRKLKDAKFPLDDNWRNLVLMESPSGFKKLGWVKPLVQE